ncbi:terminase [Peribacillus muralis]|uniref:Terminase n=1 Tax=Peribacillus muralis TaxID=264697 RepID=A0A1B3XMQ1_9BACI|nr:terminase small subunit [Peribacillus muralis]AOH54473.1 terminase [Peribacillus muralis]
MKLTEKQKRFADFYIETGNGVDSARRAGYKGNNLNKIASENLTKLDIRKYVDERIAEKESKQIAKQDEVLTFLTSIMRGEQKEEVLRGIGEGAQTIDDMDVGAKDRIKAAELLGKRYAMWTDKQDIDVKGVVTFVDDIGDEDGA